MKKRLVLVLVFIEIVLFIWLSMYQLTKEYSFWKNFAAVPSNKTSNNTLFYGCLDNVVTVMWGGRFGNAFMHYASALGVAMKYNMTMVMPKQVALDLRAAFEGLETPSMEEYLSGRTGLDGKPCASRVKESEIYRTTLRWDSKKREPILEGTGPIIVELWSVHEKYVAYVAPMLRAKLRFLPHLRDYARRILLPLGEQVAREARTNMEEVVYLGMHSRRTDYLSHIRNAHGVTHLADECYFVRAVDWLRKTIEKSRVLAAGHGPMPPRPPIVVVVSSDDMQWVWEKLMPELRRNVVNRQRSAVRVFAAGGGGKTQADAIKDLALLASCNHTILTCGTYAMTAALMAGGQTVVFDVLRRDYLTMLMAQQFTNWTIMQ